MPAESTTMPLGEYNVVNVAPLPSPSVSTVIDEETPPATMETMLVVTFHLRIVCFSVSVKKTFPDASSTIVVGLIEVTNESRLSSVP